MKPYCTKLQDLLATDGPEGIRDNPRAQNHLVDCTECFAFLETLGELAEHVRSLPLVDAPDDVVEALLARAEIAKGEPEPTRPVRRSLLDRLWSWLERNQRPGPLVWATGSTAMVAVLLLLTAYLVDHALRNAPERASPIVVKKYIPPPPKIVDSPSSKDEVQKLRREMPAPTPDASEPLDDQTGESLYSLGYVGWKESAEEGYVEHVKVHRAPPVVDLRSTSATSKFSDEFIQDLPVPGRFYQNVLTLAPGVQDADTDKNVDSIEETEAITSGTAGEFGRALGAFARIEAEDAAEPARRFLAERSSLEDLRFEEATGYWANTYVPGDPGMRLLQSRLERAERAAVLPAVGADTLLHDGSRRPIQPFDPPTDSALAVFLHADRSSLDQEGHMLVQVGLRGALRHGGSRPAMNVGVVLDLRGEIPVNVAASMRALLDALNEAKQAGDRFRVVVAGRPGATVVEPVNFRHGYLAVTLENLFDEGLQPEGPTLDLVQATATAIREVANADDPSMPLGSSAVLLFTHQPSADASGPLADMAHQSAVAGVPVSVIGIGDGVALDEIDRITLSGQGNRRLLGSAAEAAGLIDRELAAASRVIARVVRLRIRLAPGVRLVEVVGSTRLDETASQRVREAEKSIDLRLARNLGIEGDRGEDEDGIQIVIPNFYAGDRHFILLDVVADGPGPVGDVTARYKDLVFLRNGVSRAGLALPSGDRAAGLLELDVLKSYLAHRLYETLDESGVALADGDQEEAAELLTEFQELLQGLRSIVPGFKRDPDLARDIAMLGEYREILAGNGLVEGTQITYLSDSLRYAARLKVLPPYAEETLP